MAYTQDNFQEWIFYISDKMDYFISDFAKKNNLNLNYSIDSLNELEQWIITNFNTPQSLIDDNKLLDFLTIYIGETFRMHIGGKWYMDLDNKESAYYHMPVLTSPDYKGIIYKSPLTLVTASVDRKMGNYISSILKNNMQKMNK